MMGKKPSINISSSKQPAKVSTTNKASASRQLLELAVSLMQMIRAFITNGEKVPALIMQGFEMF